MTLTQKLAEYLVSTSFEDLPKEVIRYVKLCIFDWLGVTLGGSREEVGSIILECAREMGGNQQATIVGKGMKTNVLLASLINGSMSHVLDFDDTLTGASIHPSVCLAPAVIAVGEYAEKSGKEILTAFALGFEIATRIGAAAGISHYQHGWHATATFGHFGAVAGAGKLLDLDVPEMVNAFGIAGTQISGLRQVFGTMCKPFHAGKAAMDGVLSALLAKKGFDSSKEILEGRYGVGRVYAPGADGKEIATNLGKSYQILDVAFKPYASALATHSTIEAIVDIKQKDDVEADDVLSIEVDLGALPISVVDNKDPKTGLEEKFSIHHCAALAFIKGTVGQDMFSEEKVEDPRLVDFRKRVETRLNPDFKQFETKVIVKTRDGGRFERFIPKPKGSPENPMTFDEMKIKFKSLVYPVISKKNAREIFYKIKYLEDMVDIGELMVYCNPN